MKIAFLNVSYGVVERGAERFVDELSKRLKEKGIGVDIISANKPYKVRWPIVWRTYLDPFGIQVTIFTLKNLGRLWREKYDVVIPIDGGWQPAFVRIITWLYGGKIVISGQSGKGWDDRNNLWCFGGKMDFKLERPVVIAVGALDRDKRMDLVIRAMSQVPKGSLVIVGKGPLRLELERLAKSILKGRFLITSFDFNKMPQVYRGADVLTLASPWYRSFEMVIVEAMATNLPVVVNDELTTTT
ncbi:MAG: Glycosyl transferase, group 1 [Candidatus Woesebacteria bacterium GW2011_GWA1_39_12]|uniref:Glycosyl transferase, group 1 n=1 Tax=Candidatus Woesebacteria bacterium GW2011_GWA1_39_12 TaxID=1618549 RepID=A0A0G0Q625_9BACT|nr:MAG: Glycosyl transferase, group 1 [Candidatus Woesebacteria bacterium GW2011_GWA1_39_12]